MDRIKVNIKEILIFCGFTIFTLFLMLLPYPLFFLPIESNNIFTIFLVVLFFVWSPAMLLLAVYLYGRTIKNDVKTSIYIKKAMMCFIIAAIIVIALVLYIYNMYNIVNSDGIETIAIALTVCFLSIIPALIIAIIYLVLFFENKYRERKEKKEG